MKNFYVRNAPCKTDIIREETNFALMDVQSSDVINKKLELNWSQDQTLRYPIFYLVCERDILKSESHCQSVWKLWVFCYVVILFNNLACKDDLQVKQLVSLM